MDEATKIHHSASEIEVDVEPKISGPKPSRFLFGHPVYTEEQLAEMDPFLPPEPHYLAEWERRQALKEKR